MAHQDLLERAQEAIDAVHSDTSEPKSVTVESLEELRGQIDDLLNALKCD